MKVKTKKLNLENTENRTKIAEIVKKEILFFFIKENVKKYADNNNTDENKSGT